MENEISKLDLVLDQAKQKLNDLEKEFSLSRESINDLFEQKKRIAAELSAAKQEKSEIYQTYKAAQEAQKLREHEQFLKREEARKELALRRREEKLREQAELELENAEMPAFGEEIALCNAISKFLLGISGEKPVANIPSADIASPAGRVIDPKDSIPKGATVLVSKKDSDNDFMVLGNKKNKKNKKSTQIESSKPIRLDIEMIDQFSRLKVEIPRAVADIKATLEALETRKQEYLKNQDAQTAANKAAAQARIEKLRAEAERVIDDSSDNKENKIDAEL